MILKKISKIFKFFHTLWTNENETWKIEKFKNPGNRFSTYAQIIGCNQKIMRPRNKNFTSWNNWNTELSNDTLIVSIERKLFPQLLIPLLHNFFWDTLYIIFQMNWVFATNSYVLIPISFQPEVVDLWHFKLRVLVRSKI